MKKLISLLLISVILLLSVGCKEQEQKESTEHSETQETQEIQATKVRATYKPNVQYQNKVAFGFESIIEDGGIYRSFDKLLEETNTTDIVKATYLGAAKRTPNCYFFFEINEVVRGEIIDTTIAVPEINVRYSISTPDCPISGYHTYTDYVVGSKYLLLLERTSTPHLAEKDIANISPSYLVIPLDNAGEPIVSESLLYNQNLLLHVESEEIKKQINDGKLIDCILELTKEDAYKYKDSPINIIDKDTVIDRADYVLNIEIVSCVGSEYSNLSAEYRCKFISASKGSVSWQPTTESGYVYVELTKSKIKIGEKYTVAVGKQAGKYFLISRNAIFPYTE